ncbi:helix-turn-helix transcriptional regulator [Polaromonas sp. JS666]|uniref:helix-turn-helix transcriptional regulator n=1 Tax=Polaromonas sp. (strain JS666 / ATCC BAA-500) TaxID=296591 RepID=UPI00004643C5|nr:helix-turn-helix transcriptional regulator [Polaromonas sp. JS666]ABE46908.1 transcriptional regulator, XRE family [Polaromonas sp. JS666]
MPILHELAANVKKKRSEMGLSQERLAELAGLSRATINALEAGRLDNLSLTRAERLANILGYGLGVTGTRSSKEDASANALETASMSSSISYGTPIPPEVLRHSLLTGAIPPKHIAQLRALLDESPLSVLSAVAAQLEREDGVRSRSTWVRMRQLAVALACSRPIWS